MKNFKLEPMVVAHTKTYTVKSVPDGVLVAGFEEITLTMVAKGYAQCTIVSYIGALARYLDFIVEYVICFLALGLKPEGISYENIMNLFFESLTVGSNSDDPCVKAVCENINRRVVKRRTVNVYRSALKIAFEISDKFSIALDGQIREASGHLEEVSGIGFKYQSYSPMSGFSIQQLHRRSFLAGCIAGGVKSSLKNLLPKYYRGSAKHYVGELRISLEKLVEVLPTITNIRDRCLLTLLAAGGERISEALQTLSIDLDEVEGIVRAIDPRDRHAVYYEMGMTPVEVNSLRWKGRKNSKVFLIPPFDSMFWKYYGELLESDKYPSVDLNGQWITHKFVFMVAKGRTRGRPLALASEGLIRKTFKRLLKKVGITDVSPHDIRHCYVTFLIHDAPHSEGKGFGIDVASDLVAHVNLESTLAYDHIDREAVRTAIELGYAALGFHPEILK
jgi:integrase